MEFVGRLVTSQFLSWRARSKVARYFDLLSIDFSTRTVVFSYKSVYSNPIARFILSDPFFYILSEFVDCRVGVSVRSVLDPILVRIFMCEQKNVFSFRSSPVVFDPLLRVPLGFGLFARSFGRNFIVLRAVGNNLFISVLNSAKKVIFKVSKGLIGFKGKKRKRLFQSVKYLVRAVVYFLRIRYFMVERYNLLYFFHCWRFIGGFANSNVEGPSILYFFRRLFLYRIVILGAVRHKHCRFVRKFLVRLSRFKKNWINSWLLYQGNLPSWLLWDVAAGRKVLQPYNWRSNKSFIITKKRVLSFMRHIPKYGTDRWKWEFEKRAMRFLQGSKKFKLSLIYNTFYNLFVPLDERGISIRTVKNFSRYGVGEFGLRRVLGHPLFQIPFKRRVLIRARIFFLYKRLIGSLRKFFNVKKRLPLVSKLGPFLMLKSWLARRRRLAFFKLYVRQLVDDSVVVDSAYRRFCTNTNMVGYRRVNSFLPICLSEGRDNAVCSKGFSADVGGRLTRLKDFHRSYINSSFSRVFKSLYEVKLLSRQIVAILSKIIVFSYKTCEESLFFRFAKFCIKKGGGISYLFDRTTGQVHSEIIESVIGKGSVRGDNFAGLSLFVVDNFYCLFPTCPFLKQDLVVRGDNMSIVRSYVRFGVISKEELVDFLSSRDLEFLVFKFKVLLIAGDLLVSVRQRYYLGEYVFSVVRSAVTGNLSISPYRFVRNCRQRLVSQVSGRGFVLAAVSRLFRNQSLFW